MAQLTPEILRRIFFLLRRPTVDFVEGDGSQLNIRTLMSISQASKRFNELSAPALYHNLNLRHSGGIRSLRRYLISIIRRPKRAEFLKVVQSTLWQTQAALDNGDPRTIEPLSKADREIMLSAVAASRITPGLKQRLAQEVENSVDDAFMALILLLCTKIEILVLTVRSDLDGSMVSAVVGESLKNNYNLISHVKEIRGAHCYLDNSTSIVHARYLLQLPRLEVCRFWALRCTGETDSLMPEWLTLKSLRHLHMQDSIVDAAGLESMLRAFPNLEMLEIFWGDEFFGSCAIHYAKIGDALRRHAPLLKRLVLRDEWWVNMQEDDESDFPLGDLSSLQSLQHLTVSSRALFGSHAPDLDDTGDREHLKVLSLNEMLPHSLESLTITDWCMDEGDMDTEISRLVHDSGFVKLRRISFHCKEWSWNAYQGVWSEWQLGNEVRSIRWLPSDMELSHL